MGAKTAVSVEVGTPAYIEVFGKVADTLAARRRGLAGMPLGIDTARR
ncbi:MAG TPA: hypothetical protein VF874_10980 [Mycobacterium sp.]